MKKFTVIAGGRLFKDVVDGPGWTDVNVDGYYDSNSKYVPHQFRSSHNQGSYEKLSTQGNTNTLKRHYRHLRVVN